MILSLRSARAAMAACTLLLASCAPGGPSRGPSAGGAGPEPRAWTAESAAGEIAAWVRQGCRRAAGGADACVERTLTGLLAQTGISRTMEVLDSLTAVDAAIRDNGHALAHGLGISAYSTPETLAATFAGCPTSQMSGCYHGVIQGYFLDLARQGRTAGTAELDALCAPHAGEHFLFYHCAHGMGHGLMAAHQNHLPTVLQACDLATDAFVRENCYGGAFMENGVQATHPHHTAAGHAQTQEGGHGDHGAQASADAHGGHGQAGHDAHGAGHGARAMNHGEWRALNPDDLQYPCNVVDARYRASCYSYQPSPMMFFTRGDVAATSRACEAAPEEFVDDCFSSLGREVTSWAGQDPVRTMELCSRAGAAWGGRGRLLCEQGALTTLVHQAIDPQTGIRFCRTLRGAESKEGCYRALGAFLLAIPGDAEGRARHCASAESEYVAICRRGAELDPPPSQTGTSR